MKEAVQRQKRLIDAREPIELDMLGNVRLKDRVTPRVPNFQSPGPPHAPHHGKCDDARNHGDPPQHRTTVLQGEDDTRHQSVHQSDPKGHAPTPDDLCHTHVPFRQIHPEPVLF